MALVTIQLDEKHIKTKNPELIGYAALDYLDKQREIADNMPNVTERYFVQ